MLIETQGVSLAQGGKTVLTGVNLGIAPGEIVTIVGPNGSGKSTLVRALVGAHPVQAGEMILVSQVGTDDLLSAFNLEGNKLWSFRPVE